MLLNWLALRYSFLFAAGTLFWEISPRFAQSIGDRQCGPYSDYVTGWIARALNPYSGPDSSVSIATDYGLDGPGSNPSRDEIFLPSRPALGPTQPPLKWVPGLSRG